ncbi:lipoprotein BA_5634 family protein [Enterococcus sp. AZ109]|uniref:lipoprotein BA_5634 family protein n=1 Tax=Enterococcus sp. AZ109 TaxID=2774634 RepID=UPI003F22522D
MKKLLATIGFLAAIIGGGFFAYETFRHKPVHGIIVLDYDKQKIDNKLAKLDKDAKKVQVEGKWQDDNHLLVLSKEEAEKLTTLKALNKVTTKKDTFLFEPLLQLPDQLPLLFSKDSAITITDDTGAIVTPKQTEYVVLGDSSMFVSHILVTDAADYQKFQTAPTIHVAAIRSDEDASKAITDYKDLKIQQMYNPDNQ